MLMIVNSKITDRAGNLGGLDGLYILVVGTSDGNLNLSCFNNHDVHMG